MNIKRNALIGLAASLLLLAGIYLGRYVTPSQSSISMAMDSSETNSKADEKEVLYWYDPMYPQQHFDEPGPSPFMDMELVPRYANGGDDGDQPTVRIDAAMVQNLGIRSASVVVGKMWGGCRVFIRPAEIKFVRLGVQPFATCPYKIGQTAITAAPSCPSQSHFLFCERHQLLPLPGKRAFLAFIFGQIALQHRFMFATYRLCTRFQCLPLSFRRGNARPLARPAEQWQVHIDL